MLAMPARRIIVGTSASLRRWKARGREPKIADQKLLEEKHHV
jgi:hypothetical protein